MIVVVRLPIERGTPAQLAITQAGETQMVDLTAAEEAEMVGVVQAVVAGKRPTQSNRLAWSR